MLEHFQFSFSKFSWLIAFDNDQKFKGKEFNDVLNKNDMILNENVVGDHNAWGIIDRFVRTLKTILMHQFIYEPNHIWINNNSKCSKNI